MSTFVDDDIQRTPEEERFVQWLLDNGASFPKLKWPSIKTTSGIRGVIALEDIETDEAMMRIPEVCMMTPLDAKRDPVIGPILEARIDLARSDLGLALFIMHERNKGEESFYFPYLSILPYPETAIDWTDEELEWLENESYQRRIRSKRETLKAHYNLMFSRLETEFPDIISKENFRFDNFMFSFRSICARAFGRRLPWNALVPFADCLNHTNVQTKYAYKREGEQEEEEEDPDREPAPFPTYQDPSEPQDHVFTLFPTGNNAYKQGAEVFNSYGRRDNDNLLSEYGFVIEDNVWEELEMTVGIGKEDPDRGRKTEICMENDLFFSNNFRFTREKFPFAFFRFLRIILLENGLEMDVALEESRDTRTVIQINGNDVETWRMDGIFKSFIYEVEMLNMARLLLQSKLMNDFTTVVEDDEEEIRRLEAQEEAEKEDEGDDDEKEDEGEDGDEKEPINKYRRITALKYRLTRKRILKKWLKFVQVCAKKVKKLVEVEIEKEYQRQQDQEKDQDQDEQENAVGEPSPYAGFTPVSATREGNQQDEQDEEGKNDTAAVHPQDVIEIPEDLEEALDLYFQLSFDIKLEDTP